MVTLEQLFRSYKQQIENIEEPDELGSEVLMLLTSRDLFEQFELTAEQQQQLDRLDSELVKRWEILAEVLPFPTRRERRRWWWFLHEGPQVREQARALAAD